MRLNMVMRSLFRPPLDDAPAALVLLRVAVGFVFVSSGALKFLFDNQGPGRFLRIGLPPTLAYVVGAVEIACGTLVLLGLFARVAALPLIVDMLVAIVTTKLPLLFGPGPEPVAAAPKTGLLAFAYQARLDVTMLLACALLVVVGAGTLSLDAWRARRRAERALFRAVQAERAP